MKKVFILFVMIFTFSLSKAQTNQKEKDAKSVNVDGTYQIEMIHTRNKPMLPVNLNEMVAANRQATEIKYIMLAPQTRLKILPSSEINKPDFKPLTKIIYVSK